MKNFFKAIGTIASVMALSATVALAQEQQSFTIQLEDKVLPVSDFTAVSVANDFEVTLDKGDCGVRLTVDNALSPYVQVYVRAKTLYIGYDEKSVPKDIKKLYKAKNAAQPTFRAVVTMPEISAVTMSENATLTSAVEFPAEFFQLTAGDKSQVKSLAVIATTASVTMTKNAQAVLSLKADDKVEITNDGNTNLKLSANTGNLTLNGNGNATVSIGAETPSATVNGNGNAKLALATKADKVSANAMGNSKLVLSGETVELSIRGEKNGDIDADGLITTDVIATMNGGSKATVSSAETIDATLLGGSTLFYSGTPVFKIGRIIKSTLAPKGSPLK
ncbi:MAG: DUF2807 domain-containing protein [Bacteroidales bacterium]|nr:DUF2807 domain-containing protein [Bacteroidales bacterium]